MISVYKSNINSISADCYDTEYGLLSQEELDYYSWLKRSSDKKRSLACKILLRRAVKELYSVDDFVFKRNGKSKPLLDFCYVSFSHSGDMAVVAVSDFPVGIDIEKARNIKKRSKYRCFCSEENEYVNRSDDPSSAFLWVWTRKEAYFKCADIGPSELKSISVIRDFGGYSFSTEFEDGYFVSVCKKE